MLYNLYNKTIKTNKITTFGKTAVNIKVWKFCLLHVIYLYTVIRLVSFYKYKNNEASLSKSSLFFFQLKLEGDWRDTPDKQILEWGGVRTGSSYTADRWQADKIFKFAKCCCMWNPNFDCTNCEKNSFKYHIINEK